MIDPMMTSPIDRLNWLCDRVNRAMMDDALRYEEIRVVEREEGLYDIIEMYVIDRWRVVAGRTTEEQALRWMVGYILAWQAHTDEALRELRAWDNDDGE